MLKVLPKLTGFTLVFLLFAVTVQLPIEAATWVTLFVITGVVDYVLDRQARHNKAMLWFLEHIHHGGQPLKEKDLPESLKKLLPKEEDKSNG